MARETEKALSVNYQALGDEVNKMVFEAMGRHNTVFLNTFRNIMKVALVGFPIEQFGPNYFNTQMPSGSSQPPPNPSYSRWNMNWQWRWQYGSACATADNCENFGTSDMISSLAARASSA
jgi:hypothetical protein